MRNLSIQQSTYHRALRSFTTITDAPPPEYDANIKTILELIKLDPDNQSLRRSLAHALVAENRITDAVSVWWELVSDDPSNVRDLFELYAANRLKYGFGTKVLFASLLYFLFLYVISSVSSLFLNWGFGELDWWPLASTGDLMMLRPFMEKRPHFYVTPFNSWHR
jgi:tetratricopeptide (TPR) repeat protein